MGKNGFVPSGKLQRVLEYEESESEDRFSVHLDFQRHKITLVIKGSLELFKQIIPYNRPSVEIWDLYTVYRLAQPHKSKRNNPTACSTYDRSHNLGIRYGSEEGRDHIFIAVPSQAKPSEINTEKNANTIAPKPSQDVKNIKKDSSQDIKSSNKEEQPKVIRKEPKESIAKEEVLPKNTTPLKTNHQVHSCQRPHNPKNIQPNVQNPILFQK